MVPPDFSEELRIIWRDNVSQTGNRAVWHRSAFLPGLGTSERHFM